MAATSKVFCLAASTDHQKIRIQRSKAMKEEIPRIWPRIGRVHKAFSLLLEYRLECRDLPLPGR